MDPSKRPIRFGLQINPAEVDLDTIGAEAESAGFDSISVADHIGAGRLAPMTVLSRLAAAPGTIGLGTLVLNNDMRNPVQLAWEALTLHRLSGGRFELGLGAGHTPHEYSATGIDFDPPAVRKARLAESVEIIAALFRGETVTHGGEHHGIAEARLVDDDPGFAPPRILVGGNGTALLTHAAVHADIVGLQGLGRTMSDGHRHAVKFGLDHLEAQLVVITKAAADAGVGTPELNALVQVVEITDDRSAALAEIVENVDNLDVADAEASPYLAVGTVEELAHQFVEARDRWGLSYFSSRSLDLAPVIARVRQLDPAPRAVSRP